MDIISNISICKTYSHRVCEQFGDNVQMLTNQKQILMYIMYIMYMYMEISIYEHQIQDWIFGLEVDIELKTVCLDPGLFWTRSHRDPGPGD